MITSRYNDDGSKPTYFSATYFAQSQIRNKEVDLNILKTESMKEAVEFAYRYTKPGGACLLSCASPSYSLWKNFEEKGDQFAHFVKMLAS